MADTFEQLVQSHNYSIRLYPEARSVFFLLILISALCTILSLKNPTAQAANTVLLV